MNRGLCLPLTLDCSGVCNGQVERSDFDISFALRELGDPSTWERPTGYRSSLALCVVDSIWSIGIRYSTVKKVLNLYLHERGLEGLSASQACTDGPTEFLAWYEALGQPSSPERLAEAVQNRNRTSSRGGVLKAEAVIQAMTLLQQLGIETTDALLEREDELGSLWKSQIAGQRSGISWAYLLMLAGKPGVKPDRMVHRFMTRMGAPRRMSPEEFVALIHTELDDSRIIPTDIDHQIWLTERSERPTEFSDVGVAIEEFVRERDWEKFHTVKNLTLALTSEVGEVADLVRWMTDNEVATYLSSSDGKQRLGEELADVLIFLIRIGQVSGINLLDAALQKIQLNEEKYPIHKSKGIARKSTEL